MDTLKTLSVGVGGVSVTWMEWIPWSVRVAVGLASLVYMFYKALNWGGVEDTTTSMSRFF